MRDIANTNFKQGAAVVSPDHYSPPPAPAMLSNSSVQHLREFNAGLGAMRPPSLSDADLNQIVAGLVSNEARPPWKISDLNVGLLAGAGALAVAGTSKD